jgi:hypothetical protein
MFESSGTWPDFRTPTLLFGDISTRVESGTSSRQLRSVKEQPGMDFMRILYTKIQLNGYMCILDSTKVTSFPPMSNTCQNPQI